MVPSLGRWHLVQGQITLTRGRALDPAHREPVGTALRAFVCLAVSRLRPHSLDRVVPKTSPSPWAAVPIQNRRPRRCRSNPEHVSFYHSSPWENRVEIMGIAYYLAHL